MSEIKPFTWAQGQGANVKEPIQALQESGWRYSDVPTASNFNWVFKTIADNLQAQKETVNEKIEMLADDLAKCEKIVEEQKKSISNLQNTISSQARKIDVIYKAITHLIPVNTQMVAAINNRSTTLFRPIYPFRYAQNGKLPEPIRDIEFDL